MVAYAGAAPAYSVRETEELAGIRIGHTKMVGIEEIASPRDYSQYGLNVSRLLLRHMPESLWMIGFAPTRVSPGTSQVSLATGFSTSTKAFPRPRELLLPWISGLHWLRGDIIPLLLPTIF